MDLNNPDGVGELDITNMTVFEGGTTLNFEGKVEGYGSVFATHTWTSLDGDKTRGVLQGQVRVLLEDGSMKFTPHMGTFRRDGNKVTAFFTDAVNTGEMNFVVWDIDILTKKVGVKYFTVA